tara:strand:+ start:11988 stop:12203 length:216 start_codon:yes stop_codon:yes gene_type:complete
LEGAEYNLFLNATSFSSIQKIIMETHPWILGEEKISEIFSYLYSAGFHVEESFEGVRYVVLAREAENKSDQ